MSMPVMLTLKFSSGSIMILRIVNSYIYHHSVTFLNIFKFSDKQHKIPIQIKSSLKDLFFSLLFQRFSLNV